MLLREDGQATVLKWFPTKNLCRREPHPPPPADFFLRFKTYFYFLKNAWENIEGWGKETFFSPPFSFGWLFPNVSSWSFFFFKWNPCKLYIITVLSVCWKHKILLWCVPHVLNSNLRWPNLWYSLRRSALASTFPWHQDRWDSRHRNASIKNSVRVDEIQIVVLWHKRDTNFI